ncbi:MAG TPA: ABC transporter permease [Ktedonobacteraceae bacterium]|jgi:osmoprotectant transport system permease protein
MNYLFDPFNYDLSDPGSIPNLLAQHLLIVGISMLISIVIAIPLGILVARYHVIRGPVIGVTSILYTLPALALLGFLQLVPGFGLSLPTIILPLVLYAQLVLVRNTAAGINAIDPLLFEVGTALGMTRQQLLWRVTLPLALPVIVAGIRVATVTSIGIASLATLIAVHSLGDLIFLGLENLQNDQVIAGAILISLLAIAADLLLLAVQTALNRGRSAISLA